MDDKLQLMIGQMIFAGLPGTEFDDYAVKLIEKYKVGNFDFFARNFSHVEQTCTLCQDLYDACLAKYNKVPFIAADQEGGMVSRMTDGAALVPGAMALAASQTDRAYQVGVNIAKTLTSRGVNVNFAPVLDVNQEAKNPIIGTRSFSDNPQTVANYGCKILQGQQDGGLLTAAKHYPGHGRVRVDSHLEIPKDDASLDELFENELFPFQQAISMDLDAVMTSHVCYPAVDDDYPATLSSPILTDILRNQFQFDGLVISDCMEMDAIKKNYGIGEGSVLAIEAGCDMLVYSHTMEAIDEAVRAIHDAVKNGRLSVQRIEHSYQRIMDKKEKYHLNTKHHIDLNIAEEMSTDVSKQALHKAIARDSITLLYDNGGIQALKEAKKPLFFSPLSRATTGVEDKDKRAYNLSKRLAEQFGGHGYTIPMDDYSPSIKQMLQSDGDVVVLGLYNAHFRQGQINLLRELESQNRPLIVLMMGAPYDANLVQRADTLIAAYEYTRLSIEAVIEALDDAVFKGVLPVKI